MSEETNKWRGICLVEIQLISYCALGVKLLSKCRFYFKMLRGSSLSDLESRINNGSWKTAALITKSELLLLYLEEKSPV